MKSIINNLKKESLRFLPLFLIAACILVPDTGSFVVLYALGMTILISAVSHIVRRVLFPYVDMEVFAKKALETPLSAAIVFASTASLLGVIILATCLLLK